MPDLYPAYVLLARRPGLNSLYGLIENSFSMDWSNEYIRIFWSGMGYSVFGNYHFSGLKDAIAQYEHYKKKYPDWDIAYYDVDSIELPIEIDLKSWENIMQNGGSKFNSRNASFKMKDDK